MTTKFYCNSEMCTHADNGPFVLELAQEAVMDGNNLATIFCPRCGKPMKQLTPDPNKNSGNQRFYCHSDACSNHEKGLFFIDLPGEAILDKNNLATIFCPKCGKEMKPFAQGPGSAVNF
jgi:NADH pyrophosphatase NudC (nudix superfamily)